jgi:hypothetical protein
VRTVPKDIDDFPFTVTGAGFQPVTKELILGNTAHFEHEHRFNRDLLYDLISRPERAERLVPGLAA